MIPAGRLRERVTLQTLTPTRLPGGGRTETPADVATVWAEVLPLKGTERERAMARGAVNPYRLAIRYRTDFTSAGRVLWHDRGTDRALDVSSVYDPDGRRTDLLLDAELKT